MRNWRVKAIVAALVLGCLLFAAGAFSSRVPAGQSGRIVAQNSSGSDVLADIILIECAVVAGVVSVAPVFMRSVFTRRPELFLPGYFAALAAAVRPPPAG